jgi:DNA-binding MarR family transcriptional regulator
MSSSSPASGPRRARARPAGSPPAATHDLADRLHSSAIHLLRRLRREDDASGLPAPQLSALSVIVFAGPVTLGALAAAEQVRPPTITRLVDKLEAAGLVDRIADSIDRRISRVEATAKGVKLLHDGRRRRVASLAASRRELPADERSALAKAVPILERVVRAG